MSRFLPPAWFLSAGVVVLLVVGFGYADKTRLHWYAQETAPPAVTAAVAAPEPDRVVAACDTIAGLNTYPKADGYGNTYRYVIRTPNGSSYEVDRAQVHKAARDLGLNVSGAFPVGTAYPIGCH